MQYLNEIKNKQITVLGLGVTGLGIVRFLLSHGLAPKVVDSRATPPGIDWLKEHAPNLDTHFGNLEINSHSLEQLVNEHSKLTHIGIEY